MLLEAIYYVDPLPGLLGQTVMYLLILRFRVHIPNI